MKVAVVTGGNKGIGKAIVETLFKTLSNNDWKIYLTARNVELGKKSVEELAESGIGVNFHQLNIDDKESRTKLREYLVSTYGGLDVLVNNAGIAYKNASTAPFGEQAEVTVFTNFFSTLYMTQEFLPIMKQGGRLVNVSSMVSHMTLPKLREDVYKKMTSSMTISELENMMNDFVKAAKEGKAEERGYATMSYGMSKIGCSKLTYIIAEEMKDDPRKILINCCCPGYVKTDMTSQLGHKSVEEVSGSDMQLSRFRVQDKEEFCTIK